MSAREAPPYKVAIDLVRQFIAAGTELGLPVEDLLARHGLTLAPLPDDPAFMAGPVFERILALGLRQLQDPLPGLVVAQRRIGTVFGLAGFLVQVSSTVGVLLETLMQVEPLAGDTGLTRLERDPGLLRLTWDCRFTDPYVREHAAIFTLAGYGWALLSAGKPGVRVLEAVHFRHAAPADPLQLRRYLTHFGCPVYFGQARNELLLAPSALELPLPSADPALYQVLEQHARKLMLERRNTPPFADLARSQLHQLLQAGEPSRERLAEALGMTGRTLHRKLQEAGTSYRELLDALRLDRARELLRDGGVSVQEVAQRAGFDESGSFARWFRQATGQTPSDFRAALLQGNCPPPEASAAGSPAAPTPRPARRGNPPAASACS